MASNWGGGAAFRPQVRAVMELEGRGRAQVHREAEVRRHRLGDRQRVRASVEDTPRSKRSAALIVELWSSALHVCWNRVSCGS